MEIGIVTGLNSPADTHAVSAVRRKLRRETRCRAQLGPVSIERDVQRLAGGGGRRRKVEAPEHRALIVRFLAANSGRRQRNVRRLKKRQQPRHRIGRDADSLQAARVGGEQSLQVVGTSSKLIRDVIERLVELDRAGESPAKRKVRILLAE